MRILFVQKEGGIFGAENYQLRIIPALMKRGIEVDFLRLYTNYQGGKGGAFIDRLRSIGVKTFEVNIGRILNPVNLFRINGIVKKGNYDVVHTHLIHADLHLALVKLFLNPRLKLVSTKHGYDNAFTARYGFNPEKQTLTPYFILSKFSERFMVKSFTITNALRNFFIQTGITTAEKMSMIHYGFDFVPPDGQWKDDKFRLFRKQLVIAGRLVRFKGHRFVIEALPAIVERFPEAGLVIVGTGEMEHELKTLVSHHHVSDHVAFMGYSSDVERWMFNSDIVLVPSVSEGFGVVLLEAFNCYKPVVTFNVAACNELIQDGVTGFLVPPFNVEALGSQVVNLLENPARGADAGEAAHRRLKSHFNLERMVNETIQFYKHV